VDPSFKENIMKIGCVGAGFIGRAVAKLAVKHGHQVMLSNSRGPRTLSSAAIAVRAGIGTVADAAAFGDLVLLAIPFYAVVDLDPAIFSGKIVMDACNYYPGRDEQVLALEEGSATTSGMVQAHLSNAKVIKAWNAILERDIEKDTRPAGAADRRALPIAGDDLGAKAAVAAFFEDLGYDVVDAGPLQNGWRFERAQPAYCVRLDRSELEAKLAEAGAAHQHEGAWRA
jgi:predicted dinucleotide-binding enzyme